MNEFVLSRGEDDFQYEDCPAGNWPAVCRDLALLKPEDFQDNKKFRKKIRLFFQVNIDGKYYSVAKKYTASLNSGSHLFADLTSWRGKPFTDEELDSFNAEKLIGAPALINVVHAPGTKGGKPKTWVSIQSIAPMIKGMPRPTIDPTYVRIKDRPDFKGWPDQSIIDAPPANPAPAVAARQNYVAPSQQQAQPQPQQGQLMQPGQPVQPGGLEVGGPVQVDDELPF